MLGHWTIQPWHNPIAIFLGHYTCDNCQRLHDCIWDWNLPINTTFSDLTFYEGYNSIASKSEVVFSVSLHPIRSWDAIFVWLLLMLDMWTRITQFSRTWRLPSFIYIYYRFWDCSRDMILLKLRVNSWQMWDW